MCVCVCIHGREENKSPTPTSITGAVNIHTKEKRKVPVCVHAMKDFDKKK